MTLALTRLVSWTTFEPPGASQYSADSASTSIRMFSGLSGPPCSHESVNALHSSSSRASSSTTEAVPAIATHEPRSL